jgi:hypothetical protein
MQYRQPNTTSLKIKQRGLLQDTENRKGHIGYLPTLAYVSDLWSCNYLHVLLRYGQANHA